MGLLEELGTVYLHVCVTEGGHSMRTGTIWFQHNITKEQKHFYASLLKVQHQQSSQYNKRLYFFSSPVFEVYQPVGAPGLLWGLQTFRGTHSSTARDSFKSSCSATSPTPLCLSWASPTGHSNATFFVSDRFSVSFNNNAEINKCFRPNKNNFNVYLPQKKCFF